MKPGDIVLIRFPQADLTAGKLRPALIVAIAPDRHADLLLALITSSSHHYLVQLTTLLTAGRIRKILGTHS